MKQRIGGESIEIPDKELDFSYVQSRQHYGDGELRLEYEKEQRRQQVEMEAKRKTEEAASSDLLQSLQEEEEEVMRKEEERKRQEEEDAKFAGGGCCCFAGPKHFLLLSLLPYSTSNIYNFTCNKYR